MPKYPDDTVHVINRYCKNVATFLSVGAEVEGDNSSFCVVELGPWLGVAGGLRKTPELGSMSPRSPQARELSPGLSCRVTYPSEDSEDQGSVAEKTNMLNYSNNKQPKQPVTLVKSSDLYGYSNRVLFKLQIMFLTRVGLFLQINQSGPV